KSIEQGQVWRTTAAGSPNGIAGAWPGPGDLWLYGVFKIDSTHLLGVVHREKNGGGSGPPSSMGLAYSSDTGDSWTYLGDILQPQEPNVIVWNGPYLIVVPYFYVYFSDYAAGDRGNPRTSVAR